MSEHPDCHDEVMRQVLTLRFSAGDWMHRQFFPEELRVQLAWAGFSRVRFSGDFSGKACTEESESLGGAGDVRCQCVGIRPAGPAVS